MKKQIPFLCIVTLIQLIGVGSQATTTIARCLTYLDSKESERQADAIKEIKELFEVHFLRLNDKKISPAIDETRIELSKMKLRISELEKIVALGNSNLANKNELARLIAERTHLKNDIAKLYRNCGGIKGLESLETLQKVADNDGDNMAKKISIKKPAAGN